MTDAEVADAVVAVIARLRSAVATEPAGSWLEVAHATRDLVDLHTRITAG